jgi:hypothetical protein
MSTRRAISLMQALLLAGAFAVLPAGAQTIPPPGVAAARPPTERTLQPVDRSQTQERVRESRDCRQETADIKAQYRIQEKSVHTQYEPRIAEATGEQRAALVRERDVKTAELKREGDSAAKKLREICRADNASMLQNNGQSLDRSPTP